MRIMCVYVCVCVSTTTATTTTITTNLINNARKNIKTILSPPSSQFSKKNSVSQLENKKKYEDKSTGGKRKKKP